MNANLSSKEFELFQKYIEQQCGIRLRHDKAYLIESRLSKFLIRFHLQSFEELYILLSEQHQPALAEEIIDAMTTNETFWFRDKTPWQILEDILLPEYIESLRQKKVHKIKIWSAACATGQEPYSTAMCIDHYLKTRHIEDIRLEDFEIIATDISRHVLRLAQLGKFDSISMARGLDAQYRNQYFRQEGRVWILDERIKNSVHFQPFNLQNSFIGLGHFNLIFLRYVAIYFSEAFKQELVRKVTHALVPNGVLLWGNSEVFLNYQDFYQVELHKNAHFYRLRGDRS